MALYTSLKAWKATAEGHLLRVGRGDAPSTQRRRRKVHVMQCHYRSTLKGALLVRVTDVPFSIRPLVKQCAGNRWDLRLFLLQHLLVQQFTGVLNAQPQRLRSNVRTLF